MVARYEAMRRDQKAHTARMQQQYNSLREDQTKLIGQQVAEIDRQADRIRELEAQFADNESDGSVIDLDGDDDDDSDMADEDTAQNQTQPGPPPYPSLPDQDEDFVALFSGQDLNGPGREPEDVDIARIRSFRIIGIIAAKQIDFPVNR